MGGRYELGTGHRIVTNQCVRRCASLPLPTPSKRSRGRAWAPFPKTGGYLENGDGCSVSALKRGRRGKQTPGADEFNHGGERARRWEGVMSAGSVASSLDISMQGAALPSKGKVRY